MYCGYYLWVSGKYYNCFRRRNVDSWVDGTFDNYTFMSCHQWTSLFYLKRGRKFIDVIQLFSFRLKQPYNFSEIRLIRWLCKIVNKKWTKMQINLKIELLKIYKFFIFHFVPMFLTRMNCYWRAKFLYRCNIHFNQSRQYYRPTLLRVQVYTQQTGSSRPKLQYSQLL